MITNLVVLNILMTLILESSATVQQELQAKVPDVPDDSADAPQRTWSRGKVGWTISTCPIYIYMVSIYTYCIYIYTYGIYIYIYMLHIYMLHIYIWYIYIYGTYIYIWYIYIYTYYKAQALQFRGFPFPIKCCCNSAFHREDQQRY